jgi:carboxyl-terminal processing protease
MATSTPPQAITHPALSLVHAAILLALVAAIAFLGGVLFADATDSAHNNDNFQLFWQSWDILEREYYHELPAEEDLIYGAIQGLVAATGDRYTFFVPPITAEFDRQATAGEFGGIGAYVGQNQADQLIIISPFEGMPAEEAGLKADDVILEIDGVTIDGWSQEEAIGHLRGAIGSRVKLTIYRPAENNTFSVEITRARVELPTVDTRAYGDVGYIRLYSFNDKATTLISEKIAAMQKEIGLRALILDLRGNPGGLLDQAVGVSDLFLNEGIVVTQKNRTGQKIEYRSRNGEIAEDIPLVVLIDGGSASASEVVAGALHDRQRAVLIGQASFGKGSVQHVHDMRGGSQLHVTTALWFTPNQTPIQDQGLKPDIEVNLTEAGDETNIDPFISTALDYFQAESTE